ncbi:hypothetical protein [Pseudoalteromonas galatheae]|uniref:hypothetical protein n=1 Tax=Pseudoalteromonas galatheae TaxID=579562 RepID=UPI0030D155D2
MKERMPRYIHKPLQILWFDVNEVVILVIFYLAAMTFGGLMWLTLIIGPALIIPYKRKQPRGFFQHAMYLLGYAKLWGYPLPVSKKFKE